MSTQPPIDVVTAAIDSAEKWKIPASVSLAQWALESNWGKAVSGKFNYGGITAKVKGAIFPYVPGTPLEPATLCWTHEVYKEKRVKCQRWFKDFESPDGFFEAHGKLLGSAPIYAKCRKFLPDIDKFCDSLTGVYATDPNYGKILRSIIHGNNFTQYD